MMTEIASTLREGLSMTAQCLGTLIDREVTLETGRAQNLNGTDGELQGSLYGVFSALQGTEQSDKSLRLVLQASAVQAIGSAFLMSGDAECEGAPDERTVGACTEALRVALSAWSAQENLATRVCEPVDGWHMAPWAPPNDTVGADAHPTAGVQIPWVIGEFETSLVLYGAVESFEHVPETIRREAVDTSQATEERMSTQTQGKPVTPQDRSPGAESGIVLVDQSGRLSAWIHAQINAGALELFRPGSTAEYVTEESETVVMLHTGANQMPALSDSRVYVMRNPT